MKSIEIFSSNIQDPVFTIAIPTFCRSSLLKEAIFSALNQVTSIPYDIIVVDNNPERNDETEQLMDHFKDNPLVGYYKNSSNLGMVGNWNQLFCLAKGQWVSMLHDDDLLFSFYLDVIGKATKHLNMPDVIISSRVTSSSRELKTDNLPSMIKYRHITPKLFILGNIIGPPVGMCVRKEYFFSTLGFRQEMYPSIDFDFFITASQNGNLYELQNPLCLYYIGANESLNKETIIGFFVDAQKISNRLTRELKFPYNILNEFCYRWMIKDVARWTKKFCNDEVVLEALCKINYKTNRILEYVSTIIAKIVQRFLHRKAKLFPFEL